MVIVIHRSLHSFPNKTLRFFASSCTCFLPSFLSFREKNIANDRFVRSMYFGTHVPDFCVQLQIIYKQRPTRLYYTMACNQRPACNLLLG